MTWPSEAFRREATGTIRTSAMHQTRYPSISSYLTPDKWMLRQRGDSCHHGGLRLLHKSCGGTSMPCEANAVFAMALSRRVDTHCSTYIHSSYPQEPKIKTRSLCLQILKLLIALSSLTYPSSPLIATGDVTVEPGSECPHDHRHCRSCGIRYSKRSSRGCPAA